MNYNDKVFDTTVKYLRSYGITKEDVDDSGVDMFGFVYEIGDPSKYDISSAYGTIMDRLSEDVMNNVDLTEKDLIEACKDAISLNGYKKFADLLSHEGWNPIDIPYDITNEKELFDRMNIDAIFENQVLQSVFDAILHGWPELNIATYYDDWSTEFWKDVYSSLD